jgi:hypothetical protein
MIKRRNVCRSWLVTWKAEKEWQDNIKVDVRVDEIPRTGIRWNWCKVCPMQD